MKFYDAHNHLQDERFGARQAELLETCAAEGIVRMVVNGSCEQDWPQVLALAQAHPQVLPSFGYHPWYIQQRTPEWQANLRCYLDKASAALGEIGLDRWKPGLEYAGQEEVFVAQLRLAAERNLPVSIHCLRAWGRLFDLLRCGPRPARGFLLHSFGGPPEMVGEFVKLGAYFGFPGYFLHERKARQRETFRGVPLERLLVETDAPDQLLPDSAVPGENVPNDGSRFEPVNRGDLASTTSEKSPSPIGWERAGVRVHGEGRPQIIDASGDHDPRHPLTPARSPDGGEGEERPVHGKRLGKDLSRFRHYSLADLATGRPINHPANLAAIYEGLSRVIGVPMEALASLAEENFLRLFGGVQAE